MTAPPTEPIPILLSVSLLFLSGSVAVSAQEREVSQNFEKCKIIANDQARLNCLKALLPPMSPAPAASQDSWPLVKTPHPRGGPDAVAIMRTADTGRSDPDLAGLMIRCEGNTGFQILLALVRPFAPRSRKDVVVTIGAAQSTFHAEASNTGTALVLPIEATLFTTSIWQGQKELAVTIQDSATEIRGVIPLGGIAPAMAKLSASCPSE